MSILDVRSALQNRLAAMPNGIVSAFEGVPYDPVAGTPYQTVTLIPGAPLNPSFGNDYYREIGILRIRLFYPSRQGVGAITVQAQRLRDWFYRGLTVSSGSIETIIQRTPSISSCTIVGDRLVQSVDIQYFASVFIP
jgi:Bacteriophage related domain of unknown function